MLDVHAPHERMEGIGDFLLHLLTITIGLLIALSLEGLVEWRHHVHLVEEARTTLRAEIARNAKDLDGNVAVLQKERDQLNANLRFLSKVQTDPKSMKNQHGSLNANFSLFDLRDTAWKTAQSTGALSLMPYDEAQRYAGVYQAQASFENAEQRVKTDYARFVGELYKDNMDGGKSMTGDQANGLAETFGVWKGDLLFVDLGLREADAYDHALLDGKPEPGSFHEEMK